MKNKILDSVILFLLLFYLEVVFRITNFNHFFTIDLFNIFIFSALLSFSLTFLLSFFKSKTSHIILKIIIFVICFCFAAQLVYYDTYKAIISLYSFGQAGQVMEFGGTMLKMMLKNIIPLIFIFVPFISLFFIPKEILKLKRYRRINKLFLVLIITIFYGISLLALNIGKDKLYSSYNLYYNDSAPVISVEKLGLLTTTRLDIKRTIFGFEPKVEIENTPITEEPIVINYDPNKLNYNFLELAENETNSNIKTIHNYFANESPTYQNEYTGMFEGKNLILILAEALDPIAIDQNITPTLYKLTNEGFKFNNYYTPLFPVSTSDGEYIQQVGLIPEEGVWSLKESYQNQLPFTMANMLSAKNYKTQAYHGHTGTYYNRYQSIPNLGYDSFKACKMGLNINCRSWPESDLEMINATVDEYINAEHFMTYYISISGHLNYTRTGNAMVRKNWDYVKDLPYSDLTKGFISAQKELDLALESLINKLEAAGKLADTVIAINPDHYPYGLNLSNLNEVSDYYRDDNFEKHHSTFILWNSEMEPVEVDTLSSNLDVLPTLANLFGLDYDSRLLMGKDVFSEHDPIVIFSNRSFITNEGRYNSLTKKFEGNEVDESYIENKNKLIYNKFKISKLILEEDYYKYLK